jgi:hypothetical protein
LLVGGERAATSLFVSALEDPVSAPNGSGDRRGRVVGRPACEGCVWAVDAGSARGCGGSPPCRSVAGLWVLWWGFGSWVGGGCGD